MLDACFNHAILHLVGRLEGICLLVDLKRLGLVVEVLVHITSLQEVNKLLKQFEGTRKMMKLAAGGGLAQQMRNLRRR